MRPRLIVPGLHGSPEGHWQAILQRQSRSAVRVEQNSWDQPILDQWLERLMATIEAHPGAIAVGHSLGSILIAHAASRFPGLKLGGALLVASRSCAISRRSRPRRFASLLSWWRAAPIFS